MKVMSTVNIAELKSKLSHFLRLVRKGETVLIKDRAEVVAELSPHRKAALSKRENLIREGKLLPASRSLKGLKFSRLKKPFSSQDLLDEVREDR
jgi:antitoxin (DNA-binding transcriptional repressor) of toxin-antitoxin stability system